MIKNIGKYLVVFILVLSLCQLAFADETTMERTDGAPSSSDSSSTIDPVGGRSSDVMNELTGSNAEIASQGEKPVFNTVGNINNNDSDAYDRTPGHTLGSDNHLYIGKVNEGTTLPPNSQAATIVCDGNTFVGEGGKFDSSAYAAFRLQVNAYVAQNPNASPTDINNFVESITDGKAHYGVYEMGIEGNEAYMNFEPGDSAEAFVIIMGITDDPNGRITLKDICSDALAGLTLFDILNMPWEDLMKIIQDKANTDSGLNDLGASIGNGNKTDKDEGYGKAYYKPSYSYIPFTDRTPTASASIWNTGNYYDVTKAIPTSEELSAHAQAKAALYTIIVRSQNWKCGYSDVSIAGNVDWSWDEEVEKTDTWWDESGERHTRKYTETVTHPGVEKETRTGLSYGPITFGDFYDVPTSIIDPLTGGSASAKHNEGNVVGSVGLGAGPGGPGPKTLELIKVFKKIDDCTTSSSVKGTNEADAKEKAKAELSRILDEKKKELDDIINSCLVAPTPLSYSYGGLVVTQSSCNNHKPAVEDVKGDSGPTPIDSTYPNGTYKGEGSASWSDGTTIGMAPNNVIVHTPVVNYTTKDNIEVEGFIDQRFTKTSNKAIQLDKKFKITIPDSGKHIPDQGYGTKKYNTEGGYAATAKTPSSWGKIKDFKFPFDVYVLYDCNSTDVNKITSYETYFLKAGTWLSEGTERPDKIKLTDNSQIFLVPVWADEGSLNVSTRVIAENAVTKAKIDRSQPSANEDRGADDNYKYSATKDVTIDVVGKIYDLQVNNSNDKDWNGMVQSQVYNKTTVLANEFPFGLTQRGKNEIIGSASNVRSQNSNLSYSYAPKLGSAVVFNFKTKGRKSSNIDISVEPNGFYFVSKDGGTAKEVYLYYNKGGQYKKIGTGSDSEIRVAISDQFLRSKI